MSMKAHNKLKDEKGMLNSMPCTLQILSNLIIISTPRDAYHHHFADEETEAKDTPADSKASGFYFLSQCANIRYYYYYLIIYNTSTSFYSMC